MSADQQRVSSESVEAGYEMHEANPRAIVLAGLGLAGLIVGALVVVWLVLGPLGFGSSISVNVAFPFEDSRQALPPLPRLQVYPPQDWQTFQAQQQTELSSYGWLDRAQGIVRIPIDQAIDDVLKEGLPVREEAPSNQANQPQWSDQ